MTSAVDLISRGYFPRELPPPFQSRTLGALLASHSLALPSGFANPPSSKPVVHNLARPGTLRRQLSIPNPVSQVALCQLLEANWGVLACLARSPISSSLPVLGPSTGRALVPKTHFGDLKLLRVESRATCRYLLKTDISRCYHSIYTHSIPWAIHGKEYAKANTSAPLLGNFLDREIRTGQERQTLGIPVGPDTSLLVAEIILSAADRLLLGKLPRLRGFRHIDDYEFAFHTRSEADEAMAVLQETLAVFELALNPRKTDILELPSEFEAQWARDLRRYAFDSTTRLGERNDLISYFDLAFSHTKTSREDAVLRYALGRIRYLDIEPSNWPILEDCVLQCLSVEAGTIILALEQLIRHSRQGLPIQREKWEEATSNIVQRQARIGHGSEVAWSLWAILALGLTLSSDAVNALSQISDSAVALLALDAHQQGLTPALDLSHWASHMDQESLYGDSWLLAYEANVKGWLPPKGSIDYVLADPNFSVLKSNGVEFYEQRRASAMVPTGKAPILGIAELFVLPGAEYDAVRETERIDWREEEDWDDDEEIGSEDEGSEPPA